MSSNVDHMQMGATPVAGRVRASMSTCASGRSAYAGVAAAAAAAHRHASWLANFDSKPQATQITVPDTSGNRRSRGRP